MRIEDTPSLRSPNSSEIFLALLDQEDGSHLWSDHYGGPVDDHGEVFTGSFSDTMRLGDFELTADGGSDVFVASIAIAPD